MWKNKVFKIKTLKILVSLLYRTTNGYTPLEASRANNGKVEWRKGDPNFNIRFKFFLKLGGGCFFLGVIYLGRVEIPPKNSYKPSIDPNEVSLKRRTI